MNTSFNQNNLFWRLIFPLGILIAVVAQLVATTCGLGLTFDSYLYLEGAAWFNGEVGGTITDQPVFQAKPPFFSWLISLIPWRLLPYFYTLLLFVNLLILARIINSNITAIFWQASAYMAISMFTPLIMVHVYLWSEPVFLVFLYSFVLILLQSMKSEPSNRKLVLLACLAIAMVLTRHVGLFFVISLFLAMGLSSGIRWRSALIIILPALLVFLVWNFGLMMEGFSGRLTTLKSPISGGTWARLQNFVFYLDTASTWILPNSVNRLLRIAVFLLVILLIVYFTRRFIKRSPVVKTLLIIIAGYYLMMHLSFLIDASSADRYLAPVYPLAIILVFHLLAQLSNSANLWLKYLVIIWLFYPAGRTIKNTIFWRDKICHEAATFSVNFRDNYKVNRVR